MSEPETALPNKEKEFSKWYDEVLKRADLIDIRYGVKGFVVYKPNAMKMIKKIYRMFEDELEKTGHRPVLFPVVIPFSFFKRESEHIKGFEKQVFLVERAGGDRLEEKLVLRPTSETAFYPMFSLWIQSYKDLPMKLYQSVAVYRYETKATRPLLRGREFLWIETHNVFPSEEEARNQIKEDIEIARRVCERLGLAFIVVEREPYDKFPGAVNSYAYDALLPNNHVLQIATTHYLGQNFSRAFNVRFMSPEGSYETPHTTCFGPGISRILAAVILTHGDDFGLVLPFGFAVHDVVIVPIPYKGVENEVYKKSRSVYESLRRAGYDVVLDDEDLTPGEKYYKWEMLGVPVRIEIGRREASEGYVTIFRRDTRTRIRVSDEELLDKITELREDILRVLRERAWKKLEDSIKSAKSRDEVLALAARGKIIRTNFCGRESCARDIKEVTGGYEVRGRRIDVDEEPDGPCSWCGEPASRVVYLAKAY